MTNDREQMQSIERDKASLEKLKTSNEELQAVNTELRSATEKLETSKEQLQSVNEELITVNRELKKKVDETAKSNDDLQNFITASEIAMVFIDHAMRVNRYTPRAADIFNLIAGDIGRPLHDLTHRLHYDTLYEDAANVFDTARAIEREVKSDAGNRYIARLIPYRTTEDRIDCLVLTFIDVTNLHAAQKKLREEEKRMRLVAASTRDYAIITQDQEGRITSWNSGAQRIFGYQEAEMIGQPIDVIFTPEDRARGAPMEEMSKARSDGRAEDERWHMRKDGSRFYCSGVMTLLEDGDMSGFAKIARDLTGVKEAEVRREAVLAHETDVRRQAEGASRMREEFLAILSHELKQPLNLIHLNAELLKRIPDSRDSPTIQRVADTIRGAAISQSTIINDLLDLSRVRTGKLRLDKAPVDLVLTLDNIMQAFAGDAAVKNIALINVTTEQSIVIAADVTRIEQIIWNLLSNAIKFTPDGGKVSAGLAIGDAMVCLTVDDTGKGIQAEFLPYVFDMFNQADGSTTREHGGLGIGLALVKQLTDSHGGHCSATSPGLGGGTTFTVCLPQYDGATASDACDEGEGEIVQNKHILLIDDDAGTLRTFCDLLKAHGAEVVCAANADEALKQAEREQFDLIVSDIAMRDMDGYGLLSALRKYDNASRTPVVAVTAFGRAVDADRALSAGFTAHLQKPVSFEAFAKTVRTIFASR